MNTTRRSALLLAGVFVLSACSSTSDFFLGKDNRPAPKPLPLAFWLMTASCIVRLGAGLILYIRPAWYQHTLSYAAVLFASALAIYFVRYAPWLTKPRLDGKAG